MSFNKYTTQELKFIVSNFEHLERELKKRQMKELDSFPFKVGDVVHTKNDAGNFFIKIKEIDKVNNNIFIDQIAIRRVGLFDTYIDGWYNMDNIEWHKYVKIEKSEIFENLLKIIDKYDDDLQQLNDATYLKLKNEIATYDYNV
jgi:hypothetical protein